MVWMWCGVGQSASFGEARESIVFGLLAVDLVGWRICLPLDDEVTRHEDEEHREELLRSVRRM